MTAPELPGISEALRREQVRAVGTRFLRLRPAVAVFGVCINAALLVASGAPAIQSGMVAACMLTLLTAFVIEAIVLRSRSVTTAWFLCSLLGTALAICIACGFSGGARSPLFPILFAPIGVGFAAFGRGRQGAFWLAASLLSIFALVLIEPSVRFPAIAPPYDAAMTAVSAAAAIVLLRIGVAGLTDAHARTAETLDKLRAGTVAEASTRAREAEGVGAKVAHELKNPLSAIKGLVQLLSKSASDPRDQKRCEVALSEIDRMHRSLDDYLSFSRPLRDAALVAIRLDELVTDVLDLIEPYATRQNVRVERSLSSIRALADEARLRSALLNVAGNALEAMPSGGVLRVELSRDTGRAVIRIVDDGKGMTPEELAEAGTPFVSHRDGGTGLGLALTRGVARQHGGDLAIESAAGKGTTVSLTLATVVEAA